MDPANGRELWRHPHKTDWGLNISTPVWIADQHLLLVSSAYGVGTRALELRQTGGKTTVTEKWHSQRMRVHIGTVIPLGGHAYGSSGDFGPAFISAIDLKNGQIAWQDRSFARAQLLYADGKVIVLDEDGVLGLATCHHRVSKCWRRQASCSTWHGHRPRWWARRCARSSDDLGVRSELTEVLINTEQRSNGDSISIPATSRRAPAATSPSPLSCCR